MTTRQPSRTWALRAMCAAIAAFATVAVSVAGAQPASAEDSASDGSVQAQINDILARTTGGTQINENQIAWDDGTVVVTVTAGDEAAGGSSSEAVSAQAPDCDYQWTCLYEHVDFNNYKRGLTAAFYACDFFYLADYGLQDMASSWHNNQSGGAVSTVYDWTGDGWVVLWRSPPGSDAWVGSSVNDRADGIWAC